MTPLNLDRTKRLVINTHHQQWVGSPAGGVLRKPLEREGAEQGQVTSIVRYLPGARFPSHMHPNGEEILVLSGIFEDENGSYPTGCYLRNPAGSEHAPFSSAGCDLLVKLNLFQPGDEAQQVVRTSALAWQRNSDLGIEQLELHRYAREVVRLERWPPGTKLPDHLHMGGEEMLVLSGAFGDEAGNYPTGTWLRNPAGSRHQPFTESGCIIWVKSGFLGPDLDAEETH